jgi:diguanylate cyclase (GGDEF)-like protein/PAS domain S-box-containing protein
MAVSRAKCVVGDDTSHGAGRAPLTIRGFDDPEVEARRFRAISERAYEALMIIGADRAISWTNGAFERVLGYPSGSLVGESPIPLIHEQDLPALVATIERLEGITGGSGSAEFRIRGIDGAWHWMDSSATNLIDDQAVAGFVVSMRDVTAQREAEALLVASENRYRRLVDGARDGIYTADLAGRFTSINSGAELITGFGREELLGMSFFDLLAPDERAHAQGLLARVMSGASEVAELELVAKDGRRVFVEVSSRLVDESGEQHLEGIARDTSARHRLEEELRYAAIHDKLTGMPNRTLLFDRIEQALARSVRNQRAVTVMLLDVDQFKQVNDSQGHAAGDELLVELAARFRAVLRDGETIARLGGDEFALVAEGLSGQAETVALAERALSVFSEPFAISGATPEMTASLGIAVAGDDETSESLLRDADTAMYRVKTAGKGGFAFFDIAMREELVQQLTLRRDLAEALRESRFQVHYQPIFGLVDNELLAVEALVRWPRGDGFVPPDSFIPLAEETGLIVPIGRFVLAEAARQLARWRKQSPFELPLGVFVNVSAAELGERSFAPFLTETLREHGLSSSDLALELTERAFIDSGDEAAARNLDTLATSGVRLVLDDFGTGFSSLSMLERFPLNAVKIDRSFIHAINEPGDEAPITKAIISLGHAMGMGVIAEGVETDTQLDYLRDLHCPAAQGFNLGRPQRASAISRLIDSQAGDRRRTSPR